MSCISLIVLIRLSYRHTAFLVVLDRAWCGLAIDAQALRNQGRVTILLSLKLTALSEFTRSRHRTIGSKCHDLGRINFLCLVRNEWHVTQVENILVFRSDWDSVTLCVHYLFQLRHDRLANRVEGIRGGRNSNFSFCYSRSAGSCGWWDWKHSTFRAANSLGIFEIFAFEGGLFSVVWFEKSAVRRISDHNHLLLTLRSFTTVCRYFVGLSLLHHLKALGDQHILFLWCTNVSGILWHYYAYTVVSYDALSVFVHRRDRCPSWRSRTANSVVGNRLTQLVAFNRTYNVRLDILSLMEAIRVAWLHALVTRSRYILLWCLLGRYLICTLDDDLLILISHVIPAFWALLTTTYQSPFGRFLSEMEVWARNLIVIAAKHRLCGPRLRLRTEWWMSLEARFVDELRMARIWLLSLRCLPRLYISRDVFLCEDWRFRSRLGSLCGLRRAILTSYSTSPARLAHLHDPVLIFATAYILLATMRWYILQQFLLALA